MFSGSELVIGILRVVAGFNGVKSKYAALRSDNDLCSV